MSDFASGQALSSGATPTLFSPLESAGFALS
jgi:hypothetical protein